MGVVVLICAAISGVHRAENPETYIYSSIFGVVFVIAIFFFMQAMTMGPTGLVTLFFSFGIIMPIIADLTVLGTQIRLSQIVGLVLLFLSFYIGNRPAKGEEKGISRRFIVVCIFSFVINGMIMTTAKLHQGTMPGVDTQSFVLYGFSAAVLISLICFIFFNIRESKKEKPSYGYMFSSPKYYLSVAGSGGTTAIGNLLMLIVAGQVPAAIQFPVMTGGCSIITAILSIYIFKEGLTKKTALVFIIGITALIIINL
jgi:drug/metabolite transporter (DMT)-like permease